MEEWSFLCATKGDLEADIIQGFLEEQGIPTVRRYPDFAQVMKVYSGSGAVDLYVRSADKEVAAQLLSAQNTEPAVKDYSHAAGLSADNHSDVGYPRIDNAGFLAVAVIGVVVLVLVLSIFFKNDFFFGK
ncbi:putative signal transducing protein [Paradesulfitobacterium ferrireducens]|uniref:DUF2007 domain-containing protein n=1 Tax=Paradesulfitobacterium ferrireducens TaxID=2816476 RepID=UPI001A8DED2F|nr:DUF2007 domain-containing protein [Paradesulfitobacterium ferrireducens]